jgi:hypothetical protein
VDWIVGAHSTEYDKFMCRGGPHWRASFSNTCSSPIFFFAFSAWGHVLAKSLRKCSKESKRPLNWEPLAGTTPNDRHAAAAAPSRDRVGADLPLSAMGRVTGLVCRVPSCRSILTRYKSIPSIRLGDVHFLVLVAFGRNFQSSSLISAPSDALLSLFESTALQVHHHNSADRLHEALCKSACICPRTAKGLSGQVYPNVCRCTMSIPLQGHLKGNSKAAEICR